MTKNVHKLAVLVYEFVDEYTLFNLLPDLPYDSTDREKMIQTIENYLKYEEFGAETIQLLIEEVQENIELDFDYELTNDEKEVCLKRAKEIVKLLNEEN